MLLTHQLENVQQLAEQLAISRAELGRSSLDGRATLDAADQMMQRASEWFEMMLDDLEKRIKDEGVLEMRHNTAVDKKIGPILQKLYDLSILYETLNSLDKKTSHNDQTMRACKQNIQLARESIAKLLSNDAKIRASMVVKPIMIPLAANVSSAFIGFEHALLEMMSFTTSSPAATKLMETIISQMTGIHRAVMKAAPRAPMSQYIRSLTSAGEHEKLNHWETTCNLRPYLHYSSLLSPIEAKITNFNASAKPAHQALCSKMGLGSVALQARLFAIISPTLPLPE
ncbi:unnamed protein product [Heligmosomoides polygyrus]|uniref:Conserved oligomeric Golgi complex subunit 5 n=1 Tax=Heligmosomoides polygyrus TaxID=6339 RepID=A0A183FGW0_HELPZ|nr:unnamed protein product [Heligmosomoides polygyrus]